MMNLTAQDRPGARTDLDETVVYEPHDAASPHVVDQEPIGHDQQPTGSFEMPMPTPQGQHRYTFSSGARPLDGYTIKRAIGRGGFGEVYYATSDSGKEVALKLILRNLEVERRGVVQCMNLKCPNLLAVYDLRTTDAGDTFVVMEYVAGPSLANELARHPEGLPMAEARAWLRGLVDGVAYLHDHGIVHRDLKPGNLFMEEGIVKIGDYGLAKLITPSQGSEHSESIGTCHYMAPEIASGKYNKPIDIYAMGVILYEMLTGRVPFDGETVGEVLMKHLTSRPDVSMLAEPYRSIVAKALAKDPNQRPQRVFELLPPDDAPKTPNVRFIGDGKTAPPLPDSAFAQAEAKAKKDDGVFRIEAEEPVFYIGPDTRPPRPPLNQRLKAVWRRPAPARPQNPPRPVAAAAMPRAPQPAPRPVKPVRQVKAPVQPPPPPSPPPLPGARVRVAELTSSMLWAAPITALLAVPVALAFGVDPSAQPERVAFLFGMSLLGAWGSLLPSKLFEGRVLGTKTRRAMHLAVGALVGLAGAALANWVEIGSLPGWDVGIDRRLVQDIAPGSPGSPVGFVAYFGLLSLIAGLPWLPSRDRVARLRIWPVVKAGAVAGLLGLVLPFPEPWGLGIGVLTAVVAQAVSPWSKPAAVYARYAARAAKQARKVA